MEIYDIKDDIRLMCEPASSFPEDIMGAHKRLHEKISPAPERKYYGISRPGADGNITYYAAVEEIGPGEVEKSGFESIVLKKGSYLGKNVPDYMNNTNAIGEVFRELIHDPNIDPEGWCVECYETKSDVRCMVRLK